MKTILFLGAAVFQLPPIQYALQQAYNVITTDNRPKNIGHSNAHKAYFISTIDRNAVLTMAQKENIDGILSYGSDVSAPTAAYVSEQLGLPTNGLTTITTLTSKVKFRQFLREQQLQHQSFRYFTNDQRLTIYPYLQKVDLPVVIKPMDASGSKGVTILNTENIAIWEQKINHAFQHSKAKIVIIEQFIARQGHQICGDGYMEQGKLIFIEFGDGYFYQDKTHLAPYAESFPTQHSPHLLEKAQHQLEAILQKVGFKQGTFNFDIWITPQQEVFINEIGPRSGGNFIPQAIQQRTNIDLVAAAVEGCWNSTYRLPLPQKNKAGFSACYMLHTLKQGILKQVIPHSSIQQNIVAYHPYLDIGDVVTPFLQANHAIGNYLLEFETQAEMVTKMNQINDYFEVILT